MFCFQCEQTAGGKGCTRIGICGKNADVASAQDELTSALIGLARAAEGKKPDRQTDELIMQALFVTLTNVNFDAARIEELKEQVEREKAKLGGAEDFDAASLFSGDVDMASLRSTLLFGIRGMAAYAWHAHILGKDDDEVTAWLY
ncbi:MAG: hydroxylamine reductase, partial [Dehalococcoidales bacterium]|nr:hydroxylamine reductase [Dehalococcoidales bacterium]